jgi:flagellin
MVRINTNIPSLTAQVNLARSNRDLSATLQRLSSGLRINRGADDPAGLIASETLRAEIASIGRAIGNTQRASNVIATTEGALSEVASLLIEIKGLTVEAANAGALSADEIRANQLQVDSAIDSITRIANATTFAGQHLLNGNLAYQTSAVTTSAITALDIQSAQMGEQAYLNVTVSGIAAAERGTLYLSAATVGASAVVLEIASNRGVEVFNFTANYQTSNVQAAINAVTDSTGVSAVFSGTVLKIRSIDYGTDAFVSVRALPSGGAMTVEDTTGTTTQRDAGADIQVAINGASVVGTGREVTLNTNSIDMTMKLDAAFISTTEKSFQITGGGFLFQLGPHINTQEQIKIGVQSVIASRLGSTENGFLNEVATGGPKSLVGGQTSSAAKIIEEAIQQVAILRGRLGAFERNTLDSNANALRVALENVTAAESSIRDADFAMETAALTRSQILVSAGTSVLAMANQTPQSVLALLQ